MNKKFEDRSLVSKTIIILFGVGMIVRFVASILIAIAYPTALNLLFHVSRLSAVVLATPFLLVLTDKEEVTV